MLYTRLLTNSAEQMISVAVHCILSLPIWCVTIFNKRLMTVLQRFFHQFYLKMGNPECKHCQTCHMATCDVKRNYLSKHLTDEPDKVPWPGSSKPSSCWKYLSHTQACTQCIPILGWKAMGFLSRHDLIARDLSSSWSRLLAQLLQLQLWQNSPLAKQSQYLQPPSYYFGDTFCFGLVSQAEQ